MISNQSPSNFCIETSVCTSRKRQKPVNFDVNCTQTECRDLIIDFWLHSIAAVCEQENRGRLTNTVENSMVVKLILVIEALLLLSFSSSSHAQDCTTITVDLKATEDSYISLENRTNVFGKTGSLFVHSEPTKMRTIVKFEGIKTLLHANIEAQCTKCILSATLRLRMWGAVTPDMGWENQNVSVHPIEGNFCERYASWECR